DPRQPTYIRTVHGFGYAFAGEGVSAPAKGAVSGRAPRVVWERRIIPLGPGENVIGRDEEAAVRIDSPGPPRRHARIGGANGVARLEDLGSKNGTYVREEKLVGARELADGDTFRLGRLLLVFRDVAVHGSTKTEIDGE